MPQTRPTLVTQIQDISNRIKKLEALPQSVHSKKIYVPDINLVTNNPT